MSFHLVFDFYPIRMKSRLFDLIVLLTGGLSMNEGNKYSCSNYTEGRLKQI